MYQWRKMSEEDRVKAMESRKTRRYPWHTPPHFEGSGLYHLSAANFEHAHIIGETPSRISGFAEDLLDALEKITSVRAYVVLPNHYHTLLEADSLASVVKALGNLHGRSSRKWNEEDSFVGRKCWHAVSDRRIRNINHYYATLNYIHHNPVKHGYVEKWEEWPYSSAKDYLKEMGREKALVIWRNYPLLDYGKGWDD